MTSSLEYRLQPEDQLCFVRIPKTASTTLITILDAKFDVAEICPVLVADLPGTTPDQLRRYRLFRDHFDYNLCEYLGRIPVYITMLRHPVDRAISYYEFCKRCVNTGAFDQYLKDATADGLRAFVCSDDPTIRLRTANLQTRQIGWGLGDRHGNPFTPSAAETKYSDSELLAIAKQHLDEFALVGLTERFQDSILMLSYVFGWNPLTEYQNMRVASRKPKREDLDPEILHAILDANALDWELYQTAQQLFESRFTQMLAELGDRYGASIADVSDPTQRQTAVGLLEQHYEHRFAEAKPADRTHVDFDVTQAISGTGWHRRNGAYSGLIITTTPFRWTGPGTESTLDLPLATDADLRIWIRILNAPAPDILESLSLRVNETPVPLTVLMQRGLLTAFEGYIPQKALKAKRPFTRLTLSVNRVVCLEEIYPGAGDDRMAGVAFHSLRIFPAAEMPSTQPAHYTLFPEEDDVWRDTAAWLRQHLKPAETLAAPVEFLELFPGQYRESSKDETATDWLVVHKGYLDELNPAVVASARDRLLPVFANEVFVIFANRADLAPLSPDAPHVQAFWNPWRDRYPDGWVGGLKQKLKRGLHAFRQSISQD